MRLNEIIMLAGRFFYCLSECGEESCQSHCKAVEVAVSKVLPFVRRTLDTIFLLSP